MTDEQILYTPSAAFAYEVTCRACGHVLVTQSIARGVQCTRCGYDDRHQKTYRRLVPPSVAVGAV